MNEILLNQEQGTICKLMILKQNHFVSNISIAVGIPKYDPEYDVAAVMITWLWDD